MLIKVAKYNYYYRFGLGLVREAACIVMWEVWVVEGGVLLCTPVTGDYTRNSFPTVIYTVYRHTFPLHAIIAPDT